MKFSVFIVFVLICYDVQSAPKLTTKAPKVVAPEVKKAYLSCADEAKVEPELILELKSGRWKEDDSLKRWVHCVLVKSDLMTDQSVFQLDVALSSFNETGNLTRTKYVDNIDKCLPTKAQKPKEIAWKFAKCYHKLVPEYSLF